jgi:hypothetical protein
VSTAPPAVISLPFADPDTHLVTTQTQTAAVPPIDWLIPAFALAARHICRIASGTVAVRRLAA